jgi:hypothetical protein
VWRMLAEQSRRLLEGTVPANVLMLSSDLCSERSMILVDILVTM